MFEVGDRVQAVTDDCFNGLFGEVVEVFIGKSDALVRLDDVDASLWFFFSELWKVG
jgi:hypothetical protein